MGGSLIFFSQNLMINLQKTLKWKVKLDPYLTPYRIINLKWVKAVMVRAKTIKLLDENMGISLHKLGN